MQQNIGKTDKMIRMILGVLFLGFFFLSGAAKFVGIIGVILLLTSFLNFCPLYTLIKVNTKKGR